MTVAQKGSCKTTCSLGT